MVSSSAADRKVGVEPLETISGGALLQAEAEKEGVTVPYTVIVDMGFHRFGILPGSLAVFVQKLSALKNLRNP